MTVWMIEGKDKFRSWEPVKELGGRLFLYLKRSLARRKAKEFREYTGLGKDILIRSGQKYRVVKREL